MEHLRQLREFPIPVFLLHIAVDHHHQFLIFLISTHMHLVCHVHQMHQQKSHGNLVDTALVDLLVVERPDQIFHEILYGQYIRHLKMQIAHILVLALQAVQKEIPDIIVVVPQHRQRIVKKSRQDDKIDCNVVLSRRIDLLSSILIQEEQFPLPQRNQIPVDFVGGAAGAHVDQLHKVMSVGGKMHESGVGSNLYGLPALQKLPAVHHMGLRKIVEISVHFLRPLQYLFFLRCNLSEFRQKLRVHPDTSFSSVLPVFALPVPGAASPADTSRGL